jgi:hypothetical protein
MYLDYPRPEHKIMAEGLMAKGVDLILMHHAHVLQGVQIVPPNRICCYNLGNFVFDPTEGNVYTPVMSEQQIHGAVFLFDIDKRGLAFAAAIPTWIDESCRVHWASGERGRNILDRLHRISLDLQGDFKAAFERQRSQRNTGAILKVLSFHAQHGNWRFLLTALRRVRLEHVKMFFRWLASKAMRFGPV